MCYFLENCEIKLMPFLCYTPNTVQNKQKQVNRQNNLSYKLLFTSGNNNGESKLRSARS